MIVTFVGSSQINWDTKLKKSQETLYTVSEALGNTLPRVYNKGKSHSMVRKVKSSRGSRGILEK